MKYTAKWGHKLLCQDQDSLAVSTQWTRSRLWDCDLALKDPCTRSQSPGYSMSVLLDSSFVTGSLIPCFLGSEFSSSNSDSVWIVVRMLSWRSVSAPWEDFPGEFYLERECSCCPGQRSPGTWDTAHACCPPAWSWPTPIGQSGERSWDCQTWRSGSGPRRGHNSG